MIEERNDPADKKLALVEEVATISKQAVGTGRVDIKTTTETTEEIVREILQSDHVEVTRVSINLPVDVVPQIRTEGDLTVVPVVEEVLFVEKRLILKEEIHIRRTQTREYFESTVTLGRQRAVIERLNTAGTSEAHEDAETAEKEKP